MPLDLGMTKLNGKVSTISSATLRQTHIQSSLHQLTLAWLVSHTSVEVVLREASPTVCKGNSLTAWDGACTAAHFCQTASSWVMAASRAHNHCAAPSSQSRLHTSSCWSCACPSAEVSVCMYSHRACSSMHCMQRLISASTSIRQDQVVKEGVPHVGTTNRSLCVGMSSYLCLRHGEHAGCHLLSLYLYSGGLSGWQEQSSDA